MNEPEFALAAGMTLIAILLPLALGVGSITPSGCMTSAKRVELTSIGWMIMADEEFLKSWAVEEGLAKLTVLEPNGRILLFLV